MGPVRQGSVSASFAGARSWLLLANVGIMGRELFPYMDEGSCDNDSRAEVFSDKECPFWYPYSSMPCCVDGKYGACRHLLVGKLIDGGEAYQTESQQGLQRWQRLEGPVYHRSRCLSHMLVERPALPPLPTWPLLSHMLDGE